MGGSLRRCGEQTSEPWVGLLGSQRGKAVCKRTPPPAPRRPQVRSPLSDSILGEQALAVTDDKVSVLELRVQPVMGLGLALSRGPAHPGAVTATCWAQSALPAPKQVTAGGRGHGQSPQVGVDGSGRVFGVRTDCPGRQ